ncbi:MULTISPECIES: dethiobiotin synthase [Halomonas]|uniref:dethiobiotin synthase n=1 Tax=Halomonas TaxID=2745 RepID=UPI001A8C20BC|nr:MULTISPECIES: dethiobiotin synthase [Halomonas]MBN8413513.1 dethiobiotin synthase [Halomonas litopenaei]MBY5984671.1 dethiobiotin synthase [Halomonas sp. DP5Y7-2]
MTCYFVTGTDTDAGKTLASSALLALARRQGLSTLGLKPVASGCQATAAGLRNIDALTLQAQSRPEVDYATINPYAFEPPIAPHLAARYADAELTLARLERTIAPSLALGRDLTLIEGAGGYRVPLNEQEDLAGLAPRLRLPVIVVIGLKLGCLNHALLTAEALARDGVVCAGWIGNLIDADFAADETLYQDNLAHLTARLPGPCLGIIPRLEGSDHQELAQQAAEYLTLPPG